MLAYFHIPIKLLPHEIYDYLPRFNRTVKAAGLPSTTIHGLRHTHATILMNNGNPVKAIADHLGNTPEMIHTVYGHVLKELEKHTISVFSQSLKENEAKSGANI